VRDDEMHIKVVTARQFTKLALISTDDTAM
jgi:hypothetical protein